jgi:PAS domain S-box-containing protein
VVEQSPTSVIITDPAGAIDYVNPKFTEVTGYSSDEVLGKNPRLLKSGVQPVGLYREMWETIKAGREWRSELCNRKKNGELFWEYAVIAPIEDEHGNVTHFVAIKEDITERKQTEKALAESKQRLAGIVGSAMDAIISVDAGRRIVLFNAAAEKMFRCAASEVIGSSIDRFLPERFRAGHTGHVQLFGRTGVTSRTMGNLGSICALRADGEEFPIEASISQIEVGGQKLFTVILRDITERRQLEREVLEISAREQRRIGQDLHDDLCQWLAGTEFSTIALADILKRESPANAARAQKIAEGIRQSLARARTLARGLAPTVIESEGFARALRELASNAAEMFGIRCHYDGPEVLQVRDEVAALHLYRIAQEAITNAVRHGRAREVRILLRSQRNHFSMRVRDDGRGLPPPLALTSGMGLRTMRYRAGVIGATLEIRPGARGGTEVVCTFPKEL